MTYLDEGLNKGEIQEFQTTENQTIGFVFPSKGLIYVNKNEVPNQKTGILENNVGKIRIKANSSKAKFVIILALPSNYPLVISRGSIHTNEQSLQRSIERINKIGHRMFQNS